MKGPRAKGFPLSKPKLSKAARRYIAGPPSPEKPPVHGRLEHVIAKSMAREVREIAGSSDVRPSSKLGKVLVQIGGAQFKPYHLSELPAVLPVPESPQ